MTTRNIPGPVLRIIAELRAAGDHDQADEIEAPYHGASSGGAPSTEIIAAQAEADVKVIEATADATEQIIDAQADAAAEVLEAEANTDEEGEESTDDLGSSDSPDEDHWYFKSNKRARS